MSSGRVLHTMPKMNGQWLGSFSGSTTGSVIVNIDERQEHYEGTAVLIEDDQTLPHSLVSFRTTNKESKFQFRTGPILALDPRTGNGLSLDEVKQRLGKDEVFSKYADVAGAVDRESLTLSWVTDTGVRQVRLAAVESRPTVRVGATRQELGRVYGICFEPERMPIPVQRTK